MRSFTCAPPHLANGYNHHNPLRIESIVEAAEIDLRLLRAWDTHPRRFVIEATPDFLTKAARVLEILRAELPECCRHHVVAEIDRSGGRRGNSATTSLTPFSAADRIATHFFER